MKRTAARARSGALPIFIAVIFAILLAFPGAAMALGGVKGTLIDSETGQPAAAVKYGLYEFNPGDSSATLVDWGWTEKDGRFVVVGARKKYGILYVHGGADRSTGDMYVSSFYKGVQLDQPLWSNFGRPTVTSIALSGPATGATFISGVGTVDLGTYAIQPTPKPYGAITGQVTERFTGAPMPVTIFVWKFNPQWGRWERSHTGGATLMSSSGNSGNFNLAGSETGSLLGGVRLEFHWNDTNKSRFYPDADTIDEAMTINVAPGETIRDVDQTIPMYSKIRGRVINAATGKGVPRIYVEYFEWEEPTRAWNLWSTRTDSEGRYTIGAYGLRNHKYRIRAVIPNPSSPTNMPNFVYYGQTSSFRTTWQLTVPDNTIIEDIDIFVGSSSPTIDGQINDYSGELEPDIAVSAFRKTSRGWRLAASGHTDTRGRYRLKVPYAGTYTVRFRDTAGTARTGDDTLTYLGGGASISTARTVSVGSRGVKIARKQRIRTVVKPRAKRVYGGSESASALLASRAAFSSGEATNAVLVPAGRTTLAISSAGLAGALDAPVLYTGTTKLVKSTAKEMARLGVQNVYVVGNTGAVSDGQVQLLRALGFTVERVAGVDDYSTSAAVARKIYDVSDADTGTPVFVVNRTSYAEGAMIAPVAYRLGAPIVFTSTALPSVVASTLADLGVNGTFAVGTTTQVPSAVTASLASVGATSTRLATNYSSYTRAAQFVSAAEARGWITPSAVGLAAPAEIPAAIASMSAMGRAGGVTLLSSATELPTVTSAALKARRANIGGIEVYAAPKNIRAQTMIQAGSQ